MNFFLHESSGRIVSSGSCVESDFQHQVLPGLILREGSANPRHQYFDGEAPVDYPPQPSLHHSFDFGKKAWVDPRSLEELRLAKWEQIKLAREAAFDASLNTSYGVFDAYPEARRNITDSILLANNLAALGQPVAIDYTLADNTVVRLDGPALVAVGIALATRTQVIRATATELRTLINNSSLLEIASINWPEG